MPEKRVKVQLPGGDVADAVEVPVKESLERWNDVQLEDGTSLRTKSVVISVVRIEGQYDNEGNPLYQMKAKQMLIVEAPDHLKKGAQDSEKKTH